MNSPHTRLALTTSFMLAAAITIFGIVPAAVATVDDSDTKEPAASTSLLQARLSITTDFDKALRIAETYEGAAVGVRFENDQVVGEYFFDSDKSPAEFMKQFADMYGTVPQVAALVASVPYRAPSTSQDATLRATTFKPLPEIQVEGDPFIAAPIPAEKLEDLRSTARGSSPIEMAVPSSGTSNAARAIVPTWQPQTVYAGTVRGGSSQYFYNSIDWYTPYSPANLTGPIAVEFEINLSNSATGVRGSVLPWELCGPGFRDQFIAKNYSLNSWSITSSAGGVAAAQPYADLNDLFDSCGLQSMAVGFESAVDLPAFPPGPSSSLETFIDAKVGSTTSSKIWGQVQLSNNSMCPIDNSIASTDCVGVASWTDTRFANPRTTLSPTRNWVANTNRCWASGNYGDTAPVVETC